MVDDDSKNKKPENINPVPSSASNEEDELAKYRPSAEKYEAELKSIKESLKPKTYEDLLPPDPNQIEASPPVKKQAPNPGASIKANPKAEPATKEPDPPSARESLRSRLPASSKVTPDSSPVDQPAISEEPSELKNIEEAELSHTRYTDDFEAELSDIKHRTPITKEAATGAELEDNLEKSADDDKARRRKKSDDDTYLFCGLCHLCNLLIITIGWTPFLIYLTKSESKMVKKHAIQSIIYGAAMLIIIAGFGGLATALIQVCIGCLMYPVVFLAGGFLWIYGAMVTYKVFNGEDVDIPVVGSMTKSLINFFER